MEQLAAERYVQKLCIRYVSGPRNQLMFCRPGTGARPFCFCAKTSPRVGLSLFRRIPHPGRDSRAEGRQFKSAPRNQLEMIWGSEFGSRAEAPQDPCTKRRNVGHPPRHRRCSRHWHWLDFKCSVIHFGREDDESMKPASNVKTPAQYIASLPAERAKTIAAVRALVNKHIPRGYDECLVWGTIGWTIPLSRYPDTYNQQPICYVALASQKNYCSLYLMGAFWSASQLEQLKAAFAAAGKKLDMGKGCVHFESPDELPLEGIGKLISAISSEKWIEMYEESRLKTKAGQEPQGEPRATSGSRARRKVAGHESSS